jgi:3-oxoadipate enol-lactonase
VPVAGRVHYLEERPSPGVRSRGALVFLHAFPLNAHMWEAQLAVCAARGWHAIAPHLRGFGASGTEFMEPQVIELRPHATPSPAPVLSTLPAIDDYAADLIDLLDSLHIHEAVVVGLSMGGYVAFAMMRLAPRYVSALVLADTRPDADTPEGIANRDRLAQLARDRGVAAVVDELLPKLLGQTTRREQPEIERAVRALAVSSTVPAVIGALNALKTRPDSTPSLDSIHVPTLILVGADDAITPPTVAEGMHQAIAGSILSIVPGAGHLSSLERANTFNATLTEFLEHRV